MTAPFYHWHFPFFLVLIAIVATVAEDSSIEIKTWSLAGGALDTTVLVKEADPSCVVKILIAPRRDHRLARCLPYPLLSARGEGSMPSPSALMHWDASKSEDGLTKIYKTVLSAARLRQYFYRIDDTMDDNKILIGAVAGGGAAAVLTVCKYVQKNITEAEQIEILTVDGPGGGPPYYDMRARIVSVVAGSRNDSRNVYIVETRVGRLEPVEPPLFCGSHIIPPFAVLNRAFLLQDPKIKLFTNTIAGYRQKQCKTMLSAFVDENRCLTCVQRWEVSEPPLRILNNVSDHNNNNNNVDFLMLFNVSKTIVFAVHFVVPRDFFSRRVPGVRMEKIRESDHVIVKIENSKPGRKSDTLSFTNKAEVCITLAADSEPYTVPGEFKGKVMPGIDIKHAIIQRARPKNDIVLVKGGKATAYSRIIPTNTRGVVRLCYTPNINTHQGPLQISWEATGFDNYNIRNRMALRPRDLWCTINGVPCNGTIVINGVVICADDDEVFDPVTGDCVDHDNTVDMAIVLAAILFAIIVVGTIIAIVYGMHIHYW